MIKSVKKAPNPALTNKKLKAWHEASMRGNKKALKRLKKACDEDYVLWEDGVPTVNPRPRRYFDTATRNAPPNIRGRVRLIH